MPEPPQYPRVPCDSCRAPMIWAQLPSGDKIPLDAEPVAVTGGDATHKLIDRPGMPPIAKPITNQAQLFGATHAWRSHFKTCTHAERHRRRSTGRREHS